MRTWALIVAAAAFASMCRPSQAETETLRPATTTIAATCQAAHNVDSRVSASFCSTRLGKEPRAVYADVSGHAEAAAAVGVGNAEAARDEAQRALERLDDGDEQQEDPICRRALERCDRLYGMIRKAYAAAREAIAEQRYGEVERELSSVASIAHSCDFGFSQTRRAGASPFVQYNQDNTQIALLTVAITSLVK